MTPVALAQSALLLSGCIFFLIGTLGLLRFPDAFTRIHALTKVDNLGLGLVVLGLMLSAGSVAVVLKLLLIWLLTLAASATAGHLIAHAKYHRQNVGESCQRQAGGQRNSSGNVERAAGETPAQGAGADTQPGSR